MKIEEIINKFNNPKKIADNSYQVQCSCHNDKQNSLTISEDNGKILLYCHAGCDTKDILNAVGLKESDLFNNQKLEKPKVVKEYIYNDEHNNPVFKVLRYEPKNFVQAQYKDGKCVFKMTGARHILYNLPNVCKSDVVYFVEGEKDADNLNSIGLVATTSAGGASGFKKYQLEYIKSLKDKVVYIIPDNDKPGMQYANQIYSALDGIAKEVKILNLTNEIPDLKPKQDISDVLSEYGTDETLNILHNLKTKDYSNIDKAFPIQDLDDLNELNFEKMLDFLGIKIRYNVITKRMEISGMPCKYAKSDLPNILHIFLKEVLRNKGIKISNTKKIEEYIMLQLAKNNYNPILELFDSNKWDNIDRYQEICSIFNLENKLDKILLIKWLQQSVAMLLNNLDNPFGAEGILTLHGKQGIGKTYSLTLLSLNPDWISDGIVLDMKNKDSMIKATSYWISELGEVDDTLKKEQSSLKAYITSPVDDIREPYAKSSVRRPRNTSFCATVNSYSFLKDDTGNRRFFVIHVDKIEYQKLKELGYNWILQLWLQAYEDVKKDIDCFRLKPKERELVMENNLKYTEFLPYEEELLNMIDFNSTQKDVWTNDDLIDKFFPNASRKSLGNALSKIENYYPNIVKVGRNSKGARYIMKIKDEYIKKSAENVGKF